MSWRFLRRRRAQQGVAAEDIDPRALERAELKKLSRLPRGSRACVRLSGIDWTITDAPGFAHMFDDYFVQEHYRFEAGTSSPFIIDCGANIGVGVRYWKHLYPGARVLAIEPDAGSFAALEANSRDLTDVTLLKKAAWTDDTPLEFSVAGNDGGHLSLLTERQNPVPVVTVDGVRVRDLINEPVHLLKLDIEGSELQVLSDCADKLSLVEKMFVEFHSFARQQQRLSDFTGIIERAGFRMYGRVEDPASQPFLNRPVFNEKDFRLNLWCYRAGPG